LPLLEGGARVSGEDPGVHYQLFLAYSRLGRKADAERALETFKRLEEARKAAESGMPAGQPGGGLPPPGDEK
ncbi:MAG TPA: hypothetical protein VF570_16970, partial [Pyrinomonadaceae bacterium]